MPVYTPIANNEQGVSVRSKLNYIGTDNQLSIRVVSQFSQIATEIRYFKTGTIAYSTLEKAWYSYNGTSWVEFTGIPKTGQTIAVFSQINNTDSPYSIGIEQVCLGNTSSGNIIINLPPVASNSGLVYKIKNTGSGIITIDGNGSETIDGSLTFLLYQDEIVDIISNGTSWFII